MRQAKAELIIFDCDGVLVDSEPISLAVLVDVIGEAGVTLTEAAAHERFLGISLARTCRILRDEHGLLITEEHLETIRARLYARFRAELQPIAGIAATLAQLEETFCVASSSQPERIRLSLEVVGLLPQFEPRIYSASMVQNGKPAPDLFLHAAEKMGFSPSACVVVEDSPAGVEAAKRAGMTAFGFVGGSHARSRSHRDAVMRQQPDLVFDNMRQLPLLMAETRASQETAR